jgi:hypothetical protein
MTGWQGHGRTVGGTYRKPVWGLISVTDGPDEDANVLGTYYVTEKALADAIDEAEGLDVYSDKIEEDKYHKMPHNAEEIPHLIIDKANAPTYVSRRRSVATCAYNATKEFMKHWLGRELDKHDRDWYEQNSLVTSDGLPQANSFTVIQQLCEPYGVGVSNITVPRNSRRFDEHRTFMLALGANPFFQADGRTTNEEAYAQLFPEQVLTAIGIEGDAAAAKHKKETFSGWRFECSDQPFRGAIIMRQFQTQMAGHNGGSNYYGPRDDGDFDNWWMAIKLEDLRHLEYQKPLEIPDYEIWGGSVTFNWWGIKDETGKNLRAISKKNKPHNRSTAMTPWQGGSMGGGGSSGGSRSLGQPRRDLWPNGDWDDDDYFFDARGQSLDDDDTDEVDPRFLAYNPLCDICHLDPGDSKYVDDDLVCEHCGTKVPTEMVDVAMIVEGWLPVDPNDWMEIVDNWPEDEDSKFNTSSDNKGGGDDDDLPEYDPYFWGRTL